jgi:hypothetical protein
VKETPIRAELGLTPARYHQRLDRFIDTLDAVKHDPVLVHWLRRRRDQLEGQREARLGS